jgi:hypothetical protein
MSLKTPAAHQKAIVDINRDNRLQLADVKLAGDRDVTPSF